MNWRSVALKVSLLVLLTLVTFLGGYRLGFHAGNDSLLDDPLEDWSDVGGTFELECPVESALKRPAISPPGNDVENEVLEAILLHVFEHNVSGLDDPKVYFVSIGGSDPNEQLLQRFSNHEPLVKRQSDAADQDGMVFDKSNGEQGILFTVSVIRWVSEDEVVVEAEDWTGFLVGSGGRYLLKRINGKWTITPSLAHWVS